jgi:hypothetical protein
MISLVQALNFKVLSMKSGRDFRSSSSPAIKHISIQGTAVITIEPFLKTRTKN